MVNINRLWIRIVDNLIPPIRVDFAAMSTVVEKNLWKKKLIFQVYFVNRKTFYITKFLVICFNGF
jgi:hypothetical protein